MSNEKLQRTVERSKLLLEKEKINLEREVLRSIKGASVTGSSRFNSVNTAQWNWEDVNVDASYIDDLPELRSKSRALYNSSALAAAIIDTMTTNVIGRGLRLQCNPDREYLKKRLNWTDEQFDDWEDDVERLYNAWWNSTDCDYAGRRTGPELESLGYSNMLIDGDSFAVFRGNVGSRSVQLIPATAVRNPGNSGSTNSMRGGIEIDPNTGRQISINIATEDTFNLAGQNTKQVPILGARTKRRIAVQLTRERLINQSRGVPFYAPVMKTIKSLSDYMDSEKTRARVSSLFSVFVKTRNTQDYNDPLLQAALNDPTTLKPGYKLEPGSITRLHKDDEDITFADPKAPNTQYVGFIDSGLREVAMGCQMPKATLVKENNSSYSASKADRLEAFRFFLVERSKYASRFNDNIYSNFLLDLILLGKIQAPGFLEDDDIRSAFSICTWDGETPGQIDPVKDTQGAELRNANYFTTFTGEAAGMGQDFRKNVRRIARELKIMQQAGLPIPASISDRKSITPQEDGNNQ